MPVDRKSPAVTQVLEFMRKHRLSAADLVEIGGEDLRSPRTRAKARDVELCWELIARLGLKYADLEKAAPKEFM
jgi:hypothetical protein